MRKNCEEIRLVFVLLSTLITEAGYVTSISFRDLDRIVCLQNFVIFGRLVDFGEQFVDVDRVRRIELIESCIVEVVRRRSLLLLLV